MEDKKKQTTITLYLGEYEKQIFICSLTKRIEVYRQTFSSDACGSSNNSTTNGTIKEMENMVTLLKNNCNLEFYANEVSFKPFDVIIEKLVKHSQYLAEQKEPEAEGQAKIILHLDGYENKLLIDHLMKRIEDYQTLNPDTCGSSSKDTIDNTIKWMASAAILCETNGNFKINVNEVNNTPFVIDALDQLATYAMHFAGRRSAKTNAE